MTAPNIAVNKRSFVRRRAIKTSTCACRYSSAPYKLLLLLQNTVLRPSLFVCVYRSQLRSTSIYCHNCFVQVAFCQFVSKRTSVNYLFLSGLRIFYCSQLSSSLFTFYDSNNCGVHLLPITSQSVMTFM